LKYVSWKKATTHGNGKRHIKKGYRALDVRLPEQFSLIGKLRAQYPVVTLCHVFGVHRSSYKYWVKTPESQTAGGLCYAVRFWNCITSAMALLAQEVSPLWQP
jgi:putative transposase